MDSPVVLVWIVDIELMQHPQPTLVMAGLDPAIHASPRYPQDVDARDKPGHDDRKHIAQVFMRRGGN
jgi:hypothetical protein